VILLAFYLPSAAQLPGSSKIDNILSASIKVTGPSDLLIIKDGAVVYSRSFGGSLAGTRKVPVSSASMWLAAATLLTLVDEGLLALDEPIAQYLPQFKDEKAQITLRQLLSHTSGLPAYSKYVTDKSLSLAKSVDSIAFHAGIITPPGTHFSFGNVSYQVAARLAEEVSGKDWESLFREKIGVPCKMPNTDFGNLRSKSIGDGAFSTVDDFSNFLQMILNRGIFQGVRVLSANSVHEMLSDQTKSLAAIYTPYRLTGSKQTGFYGFGVWIDRILVNDSTATEVSSQGARGFTPWVNFCKRLVGVYAFNDDLRDVLPVIEQTKKIVDDAFRDDCDDISTARARKDESGSANLPLQTVISFTLETDAMVTLKLLDPLGNDVLVLKKEIMQAGDYSIPLDASRLNAGVYFYRLDINGRVETRKITIRK